MHMQDALSEEKKVFWKESATGDEMTGEPDAVKSSSEDPRMSRNEASSSSSLEAEKEVYAELLSSQCRAIIRGEGEGEEDAEMGGGSADGTTSRKRKSSAAPQRRFMVRDTRTPTYRYFRVQQHLYVHANIRMHAYIAAHTLYVYIVSGYVRIYIYTYALLLRPDQEFLFRTKEDPFVPRILSRREVEDAA